MPIPITKPNERAHRAQCRRFRREKSADQALGSAQSFHDGKISPPVKDPSGQRREHTQRSGQDDQDGGRI